MSHAPAFPAGRTPFGARPLPFSATEAAALLRLALPLVFIALAGVAMSVTDALMIGAIFGTDALAAVAVGSDLYSILLYFGFGVLGGLAPFVAGARARGAHDELARLWRTGCWLALLLAVVLCPLAWSGPDYLGRAGIDPGLLAAGREYTRAMALTLAPMLLVGLFRTVLTAAERPRVFLWITLAMVPLNAALNGLLMLGLGPVPAFGPLGAGLASLSVATATALALIAVLRRSRILPERTAAPVPAFEPRRIAQVVRVGVPMGIAALTELGIFLGATLYAGRFGAPEVAAHTVTLRLAAVLYAVPAALMQATMVRTARAAATGTAAELRAVASTALALGVAAGAAAFAGLAIAAGPIAGLVHDATPTGTAAAQTLAGLILLLGLVLAADGPGHAAAGTLRGLKRARAPMIYVVVGYWVIAAPLGIFLAERGGLASTGLWIGLAVGAVVSALATIAHVVRGHDT